MTHTTRITAVFAIFFVGTFTVSQAHAQTSRCAQQSRADALEDQGRALRQSQRDTEALVLFRQAFAICHGARALARAALAEGSLGLWVEAERDLSSALATRDSWVIENESRIRSDLETIREHLGQLELVATGPFGAGLPGELLLNGRPAGQWPRTGAVNVVAGTVVIEVRSARHEPFRRTVEVPARTLVREQVRLVPLLEATNSTAAGSLRTQPPRGVSTGTLLPGAAAPSGQAERGTSWQVPVGWTAIGLAAVGIGVGFAGMVHEQSRRATYENDPRCTPVETDSALCASVIDGAETGSVLTTQAAVKQAPTCSLRKTQAMVE